MNLVGQEKSTSLHPLHEYAATSLECSMKLLGQFVMRTQVQQNMTCNLHVSQLVHNEVYLLFLCPHLDFMTGALEYGGSTDAALQPTCARTPYQPFLRNNPKFDGSMFYQSNLLKATLQTSTPLPAKQGAIQLLPLRLKHFSVSAADSEHE
eukprot:5804771-Amphidinium_carterae.1